MSLFGCLSFPYIIVKNVSEQNLIIMILLFIEIIAKIILKIVVFLKIYCLEIIFMITSFNLIERLNLCSSESCHIFYRIRFERIFMFLFFSHPSVNVVFFINRIVYVLHDLVLFLLYVFYASCCLLEGFLPFDKNFGRVVRE